MAEGPAEAVVHEEPAPLSTGADAVSEPACGVADEFLPFQPEKIVERSVQPPEAAVVSVEFSAARVEGAKSAPSGGEGGTNGAQTRGETSAARDPDRPWEELTPRARSALEALNMEMTADMTMRGEPMRPEHPLRE